MEGPTNAPSSQGSERQRPADLVKVEQRRKTELSTRRQLPRTRLAGAQRILREEPEAGRYSLVTRRRLWLRRRRRKQILIGLAILLGLFPPMWIVYLLIWLIWRSRTPQQSMRRVRKAVKALEQNQSGVALKQLQEAHLLDPSNNDALYWLGLLLSSQNRQEEAEEALSIVAQRVPGLPEVESALVDAYIATDQPESAVYHAQRLLDVAPYASETLHKLADAFDASGRIDLAIQTLEQAPLHKKTLTESLVEIHYRLGTLYERQGDADKALHHFKRVYARDIAYKDVRSRVDALEKTV